MTNLAEAWPLEPEATYPQLRAVETPRRSIRVVPISPDGRSDNRVIVDGTLPLYGPGAQDVGAARVIESADELVDSIDIDLARDNGARFIESVSTNPAYIVASLESLIESIGADEETRIISLRINDKGMIPLLEELSEELTEWQVWYAYAGPEISNYLGCVGQLTTEPSILEHQRWDSPGFQARANFVRRYA